MKYPQLVSARAVNAISDWLVSRLEQLGVEAPQIYTRLLLSLLQSTIQLNDPIEFSNLESFFASRKGGNRRYLDTDALKKFNAVQCLKDIVSSEQEIATIENLVDELCEKLKDIEKQTGASEYEDKQFIATLSLAQQTQQHHNQAHHHHHQQQGHSHANKSHQAKEVPSHSKSCSASSRGEYGKPIQAAGSIDGASTHNNSTAEQLDDSELDPRDLYFRAFPALSKEMEDSFVTWRRNAKWLTWPVDKRNQDHSISTSSSSSTISSNSAAEGGTKDMASSSITYTKARGKRMDDTLENSTKMPRQEMSNDFGESNDNETPAFASANAAVGGIKRKSKRRRSRALSKCKTIQQSARKHLSANMSCGSASTSMQNNNGGNTSAVGVVGKNKRSASPTYWDTDFEGCWEMGRDLIKEFITRQNRNSRNRSTSESAVAYNKKEVIEVAGTSKDANVECSSNSEVAIPCGKQRQNKTHVTIQSKDVESDKVGASKTATPLLPPVDISFCDYDDYDDTLASVSELTNDGSLLMLSSADYAPAKRLYERELMANHEKSDFAKFEAKFNSSVEALWKDAANDEKDFKPTGSGNEIHAFNFENGSSTHFSGPTSLPFDVPFSQNVKNFWANYYNHHFDLSKMLPTSVIGEKAKELNVVMQSKATETSGGTFKPNGDELNDVDASEKPHNFCKIPADTSTAAVTTSDYYSMPGNLDDLSKAKFQRNILRFNTDCHDTDGGSMSAGGTIGEQRKTPSPVAIFLQNSIWSENANMGGGDTDESFFYKVHNSVKQLNQYDAVTNSSNREQKLRSDADTSGVNVGSGFGFAATYTTSKWSEGINAGPPQNNMTTLPPSSQQMPQKQCASNKNNFNIALNSLGSTKDTDSLSAANLENAWATAAPSGVVRVCDTNTTLHAPTLDAINVSSPKITLGNHSPKSSGFIEYSRIKSIAQMQLSTEQNATSATLTTKQQLQRNYPPRNSSKEPQQQQRYVLDMMDDGENLLTSERTHFHPIKSYVDGHTFEICSELDAIEYKRSASGYLYFEQDKYLEYTRTDNFMVEDDGGVGASANPLYANSNCEAATVNANTNYNNRIVKPKRIERDFVIKFRLQRSEIACQTDAEPPTARPQVSSNKQFGAMSLMSAAPLHPLSLIFSNAAKNLKATASKELVYSDTVAAFTRAMAHFPPPPPPSATNNSARLTVGLDNRNWNIYQQQSKVHKNTKKDSNANDYDDNDDAGCDEVDFYGSTADLTKMDSHGTLGYTDTDVDMTSLEQQWSMNEIRKKCKEAGHIASYTIANNNNNNSASGGDVGDGAIESVWGMCEACNSELKSIPANRLLRDELQVEADEIMSDLKYMQDLYIGRAGGVDDADDEDEGCADDDSGADTVTSDSDWCAEDTTAEVIEECSNKPISSEELTVSQPDSNANNVAGNNAVTNESDTFTVIQKVNRLIAELLRPDNNSEFSNVEEVNANASEESRVSEKESTTTQFSGNLWHSNSNERNIWQLNAADNSTGIVVGAGVGVDKNSGGIHPIQLLRQFNVKPIGNATNIGNIFPLPAAHDTDKYHTEMSWEHENLARIWQSSPPPPRLPPAQQPQRQEPDMVIKNVNSPDAAVNQTESEEKSDIAEKNMRNLRADADASVEAAVANLQQAQEFLAHNQRNIVELASAQLVDSALKLKAVTRKRRHSASQNFFHTHLNSGATTTNIAATSSSIIASSATLMQNNNNNEIADLNSYALKSLSTSKCNELNFKNLLNASFRFGAAAAAAVAASNAKKCSDYGSNLCDADIAYGCEATAAAARNHTIITCKYHLTAIEPLELHNDGGIEADIGLFSGNNSGSITAAPLACLIDKNPSILKHVTMVSRPLTR